MAIYKIFDDGNDVISNVKDTVSSGMWENGSGTLTAFYTSSVQSASSAGAYQYEVYASDPATNASASVQFSVAWGHYAGSGSADEGGNINDTPSRAIYSQYKNLLLEPGDIPPKIIPLVLSEQPAGR